MPKLSDFDYELPKDLIAQYPAESRDSSRMMVLERKTARICHANFKDFPDYIKKEDILVLNNTKVINVRLIGKRHSGGKAEIFLTKKIADNKYEALLRPSARIREGDEIIFGDSKLKARLILKGAGGNIIELAVSHGRVEEEVEKIGLLPLPPYVKRAVEKLDNERYQTVYASEKGATASPTAGLHFTREILEKVQGQGARVAYVTLHVNYGTFQPVKTEDITKHKMHSEEFELSEDAASSINNVKKNDGRVIGVGTTSVRTLETCAVLIDSRQSIVHSRHAVHEFMDHGQKYELVSKQGKTDIFIYPPYEFKIVDALLTNFHFPKSTLLMLVSAFAGRELVLKAYEEAIRKRYRFFSYGDCMLIV